MKKRISLLAILLVLLVSCKEENMNLSDGLYAQMETDKGTILLKLEFEKAPVTVANFITLAKGDNPYCSDQFKGKPFYDGLKFHRVEKGFVIQGGDPDGNGSGGPGYQFMDEFSDLKHDKAGTLSMANAGPGTNGSQFFITFGPTPNLDNRHSVFGYVVDNGMKTVDAIEVGDGIKNVTIICKGEAAKKFDAEKVFSDYVAMDGEAQKKTEAAAAEHKNELSKKYGAVWEKQAAYLAVIKSSATKSPTGLQYKIIHKANGKKPAAGTPVLINYAGFLENGELFDSNIEEIAEKFGILDPRRASMGGYLPMPFQAGRKTGLIPGFIEGIEKLNLGDKAIVFIPANLGYGAQGAGGVIPPNANIIFEIELLEDTSAQ